MPKRKAKRATKQSNSSRTRCDLATKGAPEENVFIDQEALFEKTFATGSCAYAPRSTRERTRVSSSSFTSHIHTTQNEEDGDEEEGPIVDKSSATSYRPNKKSKTKVNMDELASEMRGALQTLVA
ncbi:uncharacterized protein LOC112499625 [Cynara cardunculus var. scolymus]|uniref:uncharacterized protein LOC112499625 n=1 Tax=Cynara cardunculus var. scolymus TaxID=59895 RepID=UPI000D62E274|nr:uncharacterized protein LOC112499625 [Cynara cardunculus var. scolymus]